MSALGRSVIYLFGATNTEGRDLRAGYFLMWHAIMHFKKNNYIWFDLGGVDDDSNHGGFQFKARMGGEIVDAVGPYAMFPSGPIAKVLKLLLNFRNRQNS